MKMKQRVPCLRDAVRQGFPYGLQGKPSLIFFNEGFLIYASMLFVYALKNNIGHL